MNQIETYWPISLFAHSKYYSFVMELFLLDNFKKIFKLSGLEVLIRFTNPPPETCNKLYIKTNSRLSSVLNH